MTEPIIVEYGFVDNQKDANRIKNNLEKYAEAVVKAVAEYKNIPYGESYSSTAYTVQRGDTLWNIAKKFNTNVNEIKRINNLKSNVLYVGQTLKVPGYYKAEDTNISYVVKKGDNLYLIAKTYGLNVNDLKKYNNLPNDLLSIGQIIRIPLTTSIILPSEDEIINEENTYIVKKGDTLWSISKEFNVDINDIKNKNNLVSDILNVGSVIIIPTGKEASNDIIVYTVKKGDSLWSLAREYKTTIDDIKQLNNLKTDVLKIGEELQIKKNTNV